MSLQSLLKTAILFIILALPVSAQEVVDDSEWNYIPDLEKTDAEARDVIGNNVMFYYDDLAHAMHYYGRILGFKKVWEFDGRVVTYQTSPSSYITLVAKSVGLHKEDKPKTFAVAFVSEQIEEWYAYALKQEALGNVEFFDHLDPLNGRPYHGFVLKDPEGYLLEFERFGPHEENAKLMPILDKSPTLFPDETQDSWRPANIGVKASVYWMYYNDADKAGEFYEDVFGGERVVTQKNSLIYRTSNTGYVGMVRSGQGMLKATPEKAATVSFLTSDVNPWYKFLKTKPAFEFRADSVVVERDRMNIVVGYGPENYYIEVNGFYDIPNNKLLNDTLEKYKE
ncbi:VOC family protein [Pseudemcibacter aquimaris]|uniref:VOC family protein n=1 Tax=Pseudemcibacter aquimaris TaxID=2857064 RepID=UPI002012DCDE|nr:VOC family protein [Pseudemcibacter aquimaris]MCC3861174.1 VOC family protein [Pseudemcibacter aquimaris]WDU57949.1 VOC family protein [Pseudemcibacter aquimaris]